MAFGKHPSAFAVLVCAWWWAQGLAQDSGNETAAGSSDALAAVAPGRNRKRPGCDFAVPPVLPYYWDANCTVGMPGCWADSANAQCRFCGGAPYTGIPCPDSAMYPEVRKCSFKSPPLGPYYWDPKCRPGMRGCFADAANLQCRFCGHGRFRNIACPASVCTFPNEPRTPFYWDEDCVLGMLGCNADGIHPQCRFCLKQPFERVSCPASLAVPPGRCLFPGLAPTTRFYWEPNCTAGVLGCWADGLHPECRWCGSGAYQAIRCPS